VCLINFWWINPQKSGAIRFRKNVRTISAHSFCVLAHKGLLLAQAINYHTSCLAALTTTIFLFARADLSAFWSLTTLFGAPVFWLRKKRTHISDRCTSYWLLSLPSSLLSVSRTAPFIRRRCLRWWTRPWLCLACFPHPDSPYRRPLNCLDFARLITVLLLLDVLDPLGPPQSHYF
jgi:hypothetical protein